MKKAFIILAAALAALVSCEEWEPVYTLEYDEPAAFEPVTLEQMQQMGKKITIAQLAAKYTPGAGAIKIQEDLFIAGKVCSSDKSGNIYKSFYIQDETGGMEIKAGRSSLYSDYHEGQTVYVYLNGMSVGMYGYKSGNYGGNGMVQVGLEDPTGEYETSYIEVPMLIDKHIFKGELGDPVEPTTIDSSKLPGKNGTIANCKYLGELVHLDGLKYADNVFTLLYLNSNDNKKESSNRIFVADQTWGVKTWAMSKNLMSKYLESGLWDAIKIGNSGDQKYGTVGDHKDAKDILGNLVNGKHYGDIERQAATLSQYFTMDGLEVAVRSSGYGRFGDYKIPDDILDGSKTLSVTGILTLYQGSVQITVNSYEDFTYADGTPLPKETMTF
ncbi:MAG: DUF5689 domain-containing protein [Bacteroidales bacterium]|nr:DUF5689 domain-containing protein [Bacteroidales bacterium]